MKNTIISSIIILLLLFIHINCADPIILPTPRSDQSYSDFTIEVKSSPIIFKISSDVGSNHILEYVSGTDCKLDWLIQAGSIPTDDKKYQKVTIGDTGSSKAVKRYKSIKCDWYEVLKRPSEANTTCFYNLRWFKNDGFGSHCCETQCVSSGNFLKTCSLLSRMAILIVFFFWK